MAKKRWSPVQVNKRGKITGWNFILPASTLVKMGEWAKNPNSPTVEAVVQSPEGRMYSLNITLSKWDVTPKPEVQPLLPHDWRLSDRSRAVYTCSYCTTTASKLQIIMGDINPFCRIRTYGK